MNHWTYYWEGLINLLESALFLVFIQDHLNKQKIHSKTFTLIMSCSFIFIDSLITDYMNYIKLNLVLKLIIGLSIYIVFTISLYQDSIFKRIVLPFIYVFFLLLADIMTFFITCLFLGGDFPSLNLGEFLRIPATLIYVLTIICFIFLIHFFKDKNPTIKFKQKCLYVLYCLIGLLFCTYISAVTINSYYLFNDTTFTNKLIVISSFFSVLFFLLIAYIYNLSCEKEKTQRLLIERQQLSMEEAEYKRIIELTKSLRQFKHDVQDHLTAIQYLSKNGTPNDLESYINNYIGEINEHHKFISSGNTAIDSILSNKIPAAESAGINVNYSLSIPNELNINPIDITTLLGNLWNNAIEACNNLKIDNSNHVIPYINFYIKPIQNMLLISIENTFNGLSKKNINGDYISTKKDSTNHGLGLQRVINITKDNDGFIDITDSNNTFCVHIMFPLKGEKTS